VRTIKQICFGDDSEVILAIHEAISAAVDVDEGERLKSAAIIRNAMARLAEVRV
jgi:hypothetical protein